ncbi:hypothetical protein Droror1_Dr00015989 [Drosera rotundifolia]
MELKKLICALVVAAAMMSMALAAESPAHSHAAKSPAYGHAPAPGPTISGAAGTFPGVGSGCCLHRVSCCLLLCIQHVNSKKGYKGGGKIAGSVSALLFFFLPLHVFQHCLRISVRHNNE